MADRKDALQKHTSDMLALERHILEAIERQRTSDDVRNAVEANKLIIEIERTLKQHVSALEGLVAEYGAEGESIVKKTFTELAGIVAGLYDKVREHPVSRMLRDDYTALSLASMGYTSYHTFGLAVQEPRVADLALEHLKDLTPLLIEISKVLPLVVAKEVYEENQNSFPVDGTVGPLATSNTQTAWSREVTETA